MGLGELFYMFYACYSFQQSSFSKLFVYKVSHEMLMLQHNLICQWKVNSNNLGFKVMAMCVCFSSSII